MDTNNPTMLDILEYLTNADSFPVFTRQDFRNHVKKNFGENFLSKLNEAFKEGYITRCRIHGYTLSSKGWNKFSELKEDGS